MPDLSLRRRFDSVWKYALVGGLASIPLTVALSTWTSSNVQLSANGVFLGAVLAGYLAANASRRAANAGILAGLIVGVPATVWAVGWLLGLPDGPILVWSNLLAEIAFLTLATLALVVFSMLIGGIGGFVGGWLSKKIHPQRVQSVGN